MKLHKLRPELSKGNAVQFIRKKALPYLNGEGLDVGCKKWKIKDDAIGVDIRQSPGVDLIIKDWNKIDSEKYDYVFSSHCLEHIADWETAISHWVRVIKQGGIIFLYLPNPAVYNRWSKNHLKAHKHDFTLPIISKKLKSLYIKIIDAGLDDYAGMWIIGIKFKLTIFCE